MEKRNRFDRLKWLAVIALLVIGVVLNYYFSAAPLALRMAAWIVLLVVIALTAVQTSKGHAFWLFVKDARNELRRVVWPTRQETIQMTAVVFVAVVVLAFILWGVDSILLMLIRWFTGHGG